jgi:(R,R)-butanediol dehydrogenase/meso-butanediol dehydrogenase/diacetyl reductase
VPVSTLVIAEPYGLTPDAAALGQPMAIAVHAMRRGRLEPGQTAVIIGVGGIGAFLTYAAVEVGATVISSDLDADRLTIATSLGATHSIDPRAGSVTQVLDDAAMFPDVVYEVTGTAAGIRAAFEAARRGSRIVAVGLHGEQRNLDVRDLSLREVELIGTNAHVCADDLPEALRLLASRRDPWSDIAPVALSLDRLVRDGLEPLADGRAAHIKTLVDPWSTATRPTHMPPGH